MTQDNGVPPTGSGYSAEVEPQASPAEPSIPNAALHLDGWAGRISYPVQVIGRTPKKLRVRFLQDAPTLPGGRRAKAGDEILVPPHSVSGL